MRRIILDKNKAKNIEGIEVDEDIKNENRDKGNADKMFDYIEKIMNGKTYGIGIHSISKGDREGKLNNILGGGLELKENEGILSTVSSFGTSIEHNSTRRNIIDYSWGDEEQKLNVMILVPYIISNSKGKELYLGFPSIDVECAGNNYRTTCVLDIACKNENGKGRLQKEFILGYFTQSEGKINFVENQNYYELLPEEEKDSFFLEMDGKITGKARIISDAVLSEDFSLLKQMSQEEQDAIKTKEGELERKNILERGIGNMQLARNLAKTSVHSNQDDSATQALDYLEMEREKETKRESDKTTDRRSHILKILLDSYRESEDVNLSGVRQAKERLGEGLENENQKSYEGEEK